VDDIVEALVTVSAAGTFAGRTMLIPPGIRAFNRFEHDSRQDLVSMLRAADADGRLNEVITNAVFFAGEETDLGKKLKNFRVGVKGERRGDTLDGSTQRREWPNLPYVFIAEKEWTVSVRVNGEPHGPTAPGGYLEVSAKELFGPGRWREARCVVAAESPRANGKVETSRYTLRLVPRRQALFSKILLCVASSAIWLFSYLIFTQQLDFDARSIGLALVFSTIAASMVALISGWRPRRPSSAGVVRTLWIAALVFLASVLAPFGVGRILCLVRNVGPTCVLARNQRWNTGTWILRGRDPQITCTRDVEVGRDKEGECGPLVVDASHPPDVETWEQRWLRGLGVQAATGAITCTPPPKPALQVPKAFVRNCTGSPIDWLDRSEPLQSSDKDDSEREGPATDISIGNYKRKLDADKHYTVWSLKSTKGGSTFYDRTEGDDKNLTFTVDGTSPGAILRLERDDGECHPSNVVIDSTRGTWQSGGSFGKETKIELCQAEALAVLPSGTLKSGFGEFTVKNATEVVKHGLWIAYTDFPDRFSPEELLTRKTICVAKRQVDEMCYLHFAREHVSNPTKGNGYRTTSSFKCSNSL
jgi:hypothetical protein